MINILQDYKEMKTWITEIEAIDPKTHSLKKWLGPYITAYTMEEAANFCEKSGLGYCTVVGQLINPSC